MGGLASLSLSGSGGAAAPSSAGGSATVNAGLSGITFGAVSTGSGSASSGGLTPWLIAAGALALILYFYGRGK
jgi:hypothetical protein